MSASRPRRSHGARRRGRLPLLAGNNRRTTLTLPKPLLDRAERLARERGRTLSSMVAGLIADGLRNGNEGAQRVAWLRRRWRTAYIPRNEEERLLLEGIVLDEEIPAS